MRKILLRHSEIITVVSQHGRPDNGRDASPFSNVELFAPLKPFDEWPADLIKDKLTEELEHEFLEELALRRFGCSFPSSWWGMVEQKGCSSERTT